MRRNSKRFVEKMSQNNSKIPENFERLEHTHTHTHTERERAYYALLRPNIEKMP